MSGLSSLPVSPFVAGWHGTEKVCLIYTIQLLKFLTVKCVGSIGVAASPAGQANA